MVSAFVHGVVFLVVEFLRDERQGLKGILFTCLLNPLVQCSEQFTCSFGLGLGKVVLLPHILIQIIKFGFI